MMIKLACFTQTGNSFSSSRKLSDSMKQRCVYRYMRQTQDVWIKPKTSMLFFIVFLTPLILWVQWQKNIQNVWTLDFPDSNLSKRFKLYAHPDHRTVPLGFPEPQSSPGNSEGPQWPGNALGGTGFGGSACPKRRGCREAAWCTVLPTHSPRPIHEFLQSR